MVHGSPVDKTFFNGYVYKMTYGDNLDNLQQRQLTMCMHGHSHVQGIYYRKGKLDDFICEDKVDIEKFDHSLVCPGSVGQPRSNRPGAEFAILTRSLNQVEFFRLDYDLEKTVDDMRSYRFPSQLYERLLVGH